MLPYMTSLKGVELNGGKDVDLSDIEVSAHKIQVNAIEYDLYDANDYIDFILVAMKD